MPPQDSDPETVEALRTFPNEQLQSIDTAEFLRLILGETYNKAFDTGADVWARKRPDDGILRTPCGISVFSKDLVMKVFMDADDDYTVAGYGERGAKSFGQIYLFLDKGAEYDRQATKVNAAIQRVTAEEAFGLALREARAALAANPGINIEQLSIKVLAALCRYWFDLPDNINVIEGGTRTNLQPPPMCPSDWAFPSGYIFKPDPNYYLTVLGQALGVMLKAAVGRFVADLRNSHRVPTGALSRAVFDAFSKGEDDLIVRTIIGVLMGMLPTTHFNLRAVVEIWQRDGTFRKLQQALQQHGGTDPYTRAMEVLKTPLMQTMQLAPTPEAVWRTAARDHALGPMSIARGEKICVGIAGATREDHEAGITDVFPVFGGDRSATPHPTHACPGYKIAIGTMVGVINGMMEPT